VKNPNTLVNYHYSEPIVIEKETVRFNNVNFHIPTLIKEVKSFPKSRIKQYKKTIQTFLVTASSFLIQSPLKSMANTTAHTQQLGTTTLPDRATGIPPELFELLIKLLVIAVGSAVIFAAILLVGAGVMKMLRKRKEANEWTTDILKGLIQILVAVPVVFLLYYVANQLFSTSGWFVSPF
jgi:hypothetical protein